MLTHLGLETVPSLPGWVTALAPSSFPPSVSSHFCLKPAGVKLDEAQAVIKIARRNINKLRHADDTTLMAERKELKSLLMKVKKSEKAGSKHSKI